MEQFPGILIWMKSRKVDDFAAATQINRLILSPLARVRFHGFSPCLKHEIHRMRINCREWEDEESVYFRLHIFLLIQPIKSEHGSLFSFHFPFLDGGARGYEVRQSRIKSELKQPPKEFVCPISGSLMVDPVIVASGHTLERICVQVCKDLGFTPILPDESKPDFSTVIPNIAIKSTILNWCRANGVERRKPPELTSVEKLARALIPPEKSTLKCKIEEEEIEDENKDELLKGVAENPPVKFSYATTELNRRPTHF